MYTHTLRNSKGAFKATKVLLQKAPQCPKPVVPILAAVVGAVAVWEGGKYLVEKLFD
jgi:hypothetical protein